ncbi:hypothetical protein GGH92_009937 [Coemansia sp. RSA 2673]|nr:hypothetical protein GGH92_009937 [Coemansia sp. RSA 2673]
MPELAAIAQRKSTCASHFFVVNRGLKHWVVSTTDPNICFEFGPSIKTRVISKLVDGSTTVQALNDENQPSADIGPPTNQSPGFKLYDCNGEEVVEGDVFALRLIDYQDDGHDSRNNALEDHDKEFEGDDGEIDDYEETKLKSWVTVFKYAREDGKPVIWASSEGWEYFGMAVVDGVTYLTYNGKFLQTDLGEEEPDIFTEASEPEPSNRIRISRVDNGKYTLSTWESGTKTICDWVKSTVGIIKVNASDRGDFDAFTLRLVKRPDCF